jgi:hypothetical protein
LWTANSKIGAIEGWTNEWLLLACTKSPMTPRERCGRIQFAVGERTAGMESKRNMQNMERFILTIMISFLDLAS